MATVVNEAPKFDQFLDCVNCGFCLPACPTFTLLGTEMDSPRGRIHLMRGVSEGKIEANETYRDHIEKCLVCRSCETACPSGVHFGDMMEAARSQLQIEHPRRLRSLSLSIISHPLVLRFAASLLRFAQKAKLTELYDAIFSPRALSPSQLPPIPSSSIRKSYDGEIIPAIGQQRYRVAFLKGCVADVMFSQANRATIDVLTRNDCEVVMPASLECCGSLFAHNGERPAARGQARRTIDAVLAANVDAVISNAAGCGATMKDYRSLFEHDPVYRERAEQFVKKVRDISEFLDSIPLLPFTKPINAVVAYHDACHLAHGQSIRSAPRNLLKKIPGLTLVELNDAETCCGSAGIYNIMQPDLAGQLQKRKIDYIRATGATIVAAGNPGCVMQIAAGARRAGMDVTVKHPIELMAAAYSL